MEKLRKMLSSLHPRSRKRRRCKPRWRTRTPTSSSSLRPSSEVSWHRRENPLAQIFKFRVARGENVGKCESNRLNSSCQKINQTKSSVSTPCFCFPEPTISPKRRHNLASSEKKRIKHIKKQIPRLRVQRPFRIQPPSSCGPMSSITFRRLSTTSGRRTSNASSS